MQDNRIPPLQVEVTWDGVVSTVAVTGELNLTTAPDLTEHLLEVAAVRPERLVLDLFGATFVDLSGARTIARVREALQGECPVILRRARPSARRALELAGLGQGD